MSTTRFNDYPGGVQRELVRGTYSGRRGRRIDYWFERLYGFLVDAIILAGPLVVYGVLVGGFSLRVSRSLIVVSAPVLLLRILTKPSLLLRDRFAVYGVGPYLAYTTLSILWSPNVETGTGVQRLGGLYEVVALYLLLIVADFSAERFRRFVKVYVASALIPLLVSGWQLAKNLFQLSSSEVPFERFVIAGKYEQLEGRYFVAANGFSRISASFADPKVFASFLCSVLLLSLLLEPATWRGRAMLRLYQGYAFVIMVLSVSKLALILLTIGLLMIGWKYRRYARVLLIFVLFFGAILWVMFYFDAMPLFGRLLSATGHYKLFVETIGIMKNSDLIVGQGIGSVPLGSLQVIVFSRVYECGIIGLIFVGLVTVNPVKILVQKTSNEAARQIKVVCVGVMFTVVFGLHADDYFIQFWPWTVMGTVMSFYNSETATYRLLGRRTAAAREGMPRESFGLD